MRARPTSAVRSGSPALITGSSSIRRAGVAGGPAVLRTTGAGPLASVRLGEALGFLFVTLDASAPPLAEALGEAPPWLALAHAGPLRLARRVSYDVGASIGIVLENFQESIHFATVHPELERLTPSALAETWMPAAGAAGPWLGGRMPLADGVETVSISARRNERPLARGRRRAARRAGRDAVSEPAHQRAARLLAHVSALRGQ